MSDTSLFETELNNIKKSACCGEFSPKAGVLFRESVDSNFNKKKLNYGVYIVRKKCTREVLYIGKSGTIDSEGNLKKQDIPARLKNVRKREKKDISFNNVFDKYGPVVIEYIILTEKNQLPTYVESLLLQAYFNEHGTIPRENKLF